MLRREIAARLERGAFDALPSRWAAAAWGSLARPVRAVALPEGARVVGVGGATLGGSGKTPFVLELAKTLAAEHRVAVVAHGHRARRGAARVVGPSDPVELVGDEALWLCRALSPLGVPVVVSRDRESALALAARHGSVVIVEGLLQARPRRLDASLLVLDAAEPWGARRCPPAGDLRANPRALLGACDLVLVGPTDATLGQGRAMAFDDALSGARTPRGELVGLESLRARRLGLALAIARPERVLQALRARGVEPAEVVLAADHEVPRPSGPPAGVEAWLTTAKCATKLGDRLDGAPVWVLQRELRLPAELGRWLASRLR